MYSPPRDNNTGIFFSVSSHPGPSYNTWTLRQQFEISDRSTKSASNTDTLTSSAFLLSVFFTHNFGSIFMLQCGCLGVADSMHFPPDAAPSKCYRRVVIFVRQSTHPEIQTPILHGNNPHVVHFSLHLVWNKRRTCRIFNDTEDFIKSITVSSTILLQLTKRSSQAQRT